MDEQRYKELEKKVAALEKKVQEQQKIIDKLTSINLSEEVKIKHPSLNDGTMLC